MTWLERPPKYSVLNCKRTPSLADQSREAAPGEPTRGHTQFASLTHTFESLSPALRQMLEGLNAVHANPGTNPNHASRHNTEIPPEQIHPCVRYHEGTGRKSLYINPVRNAFSSVSAAVRLGALDHLARRLPVRRGSCGGSRAGARRSRRRCCASSSSGRSGTCSRTGGREATSSCGAPPTLFPTLA